MLLVVGGIAVAAVVVGFLLLGGDDGEQPAGPTGEITPGAEGTSASAQTPAADDPFDPDQITAIPPPALSESDVLLGGTPDFETAAALAKILEDGGADLAGIKIRVFPIGGTEESLLVIELDQELDEAAGAGLPEDEDAVSSALTAFLAAPEIETAGISRLAMVLRSSDESGPFSLILTLPIGTARDLIAGTATEEDLAEHLAIEVRR